MAQSPARRSRRAAVEIPLPSKPPDYRPGDGPPLAPIRLCLEDDTGAFIVDKRVLPGEPVNGELKLELYYVVGWPDLPAARVAILATKILDYVSPRTLEDWEYKCSLEDDKEREKAEIARKKKEQEEYRKAQVASASATHTSTPRSGTPGQKRRGRPSKAEVLARQIAQQASFGEEELANVPLPPASTHGPSLSTPKKSLSQAVADMEDIEETDTNDAISKQLQGSSDSGSKSGNELQAGEGELDEADEPDGPDEPNKPNTGTTFTSLDSFLPASSSRGYADLSIPNLQYAIPQYANQYLPSAPISLPADSKKNQSSRRKTQLTTHVPVSPHPKPTRKKTLVPLGKTITPIPPPPLPLLSAKPPKAIHNAKVTTTLPPAHLKPRPKASPGTSWTPIPPPSYPTTLQESTKIPQPKEPHKVTYTPIPPPPPPPAPKPAEEAQKSTYTPIPPPPPFSRKGTTGSQSSITFTPAGHSPGNQTARAAVEAEREKQPQTPSKSAAPAARNGSSRKRKQSQPEEEPVWEVKRLEGDKVMEIDGDLVRYFKVRWVGKWPPGQNPTWEPEENISELLVRKYLKDKAAQIAQSGSSPKRSQKLTPVKQKYSSVAEAFEGDDEGPHMLSSISADNAHDEDDDDDEEHFQVTEQTGHNTPFQKLRLDPAFMTELTVSFS